MKKLLMLMVLAAMTATVQAQDTGKRTTQERAHARSERMAKELGLSPEQQAKVEAIDLKYAERSQALRAEREAKEDGARKDDQGRAIRDAREVEMKGVLTPEQFSRWKAKRDELKARRTAQHKALRSTKKEAIPQQ